MIPGKLIFFAIASLVPSVYSQDIEYDLAHNVTSIVGTWSSGSKNVVTGTGFANPANMSFTYPKTTGISFSFDDTFYESARYRFLSNGSEPTCITGVLVWSHGKYTLHGNGSITLEPLADGFQQVQDPCAAQSNFIEQYNQTELYKNWRIFQDATAGPKLHLYAFDGAPLAPQFQVSTTPNMLPTRLLRNVTSATAETSGNGVKKPTRRSLIQKSNDSPANHHITIALVATMAMVTSGMVLMAL